jgi:hypothetical protein
MSAWDCGLPDTALINTQSGFICARDVRVGSQVLSEDGVPVRVAHVSSYAATRIAEIKISGTLPLRMNPDNALLTYCDGV